MIPNDVSMSRDMICEKCAGPMPHGYEVPPVPLGGWMKQIRKDLIEIKAMIREGV